MKLLITAFSNPISLQRAEEIRKIFGELPVDVEIMPSIDVLETFRQRAEIFNKAVADGVDYLVDISGGDLANGMLDYIDYEAYRNSKTVFVGYSDLSALANALYAQSKKPSILFQPAHFGHHDLFVEHLFQSEEALFAVNYRLLALDQPGIDLNEIIQTRPFIGGNIRCFLKLAGTRYMPDGKGKVLFLESLSGNRERLLSFFVQLSQISALQDLAGLALGTFSEFDAGFESMEQSDAMLVQMIRLSGLKVPFVIRTDQIGHDADSRALWIGRHED